MKFSELKIGQSARLSKKFSKEDVRLFSELSLDTNPLHLDPEYAAKTVFKNCLVHGFLTSSLISGVIATTLPGPGSIYLHQEINFKRPVYQGQIITAEVTVCDIHSKKPIVKLSTICKNEMDEIVVDGYAIIKMQDI